MTQSSSSTDQYQGPSATEEWSPRRENSTSSSDIEAEEKLPDWVNQRVGQISEGRPGLNADETRFWQATVIATPVSDWAQQEWSHVTIRPGPRNFHRVHAEGWAAREIQRHWPHWHFHVEVEWSWT